MRRNAENQDRIVAEPAMECLAAGALYTAEFISARETAISAPDGVTGTNSIETKLGKTMIVFIIYLISVINALIAMSAVILTGSLFGFIICIVASGGKMFTNDEIPDSNYFKSEINTARTLKRPLKIAIIVSSILLIFVPSKETAYTMLAAYGLTEIAQSEEAKRLGSKSIEVIEKAMNDYLKEDAEAK